MNINQWKVRSVVLLMYFIISATATVKATSGSPDVFTFTMTATVVESASCTLNNGKDVAVPFGEVDIAKIDGVKYKTSIDYNLQCKRLGKNVIKIEIKGEDADFGTGLLKVQSGLGIQILNAETVQPINTSFAIDGNNPPILRAVPVKQAGATLMTGTFDVSAIIKVTYE